MTNVEELKASMALASELRASFTITETYGEESAQIEAAKRIEQAKLALRLQDELYTLQNQVFDSAQKMSITVPPEALQRISDVVTHLQEDLQIAIVTHFSEEIPVEPGL